MLGLADKKELLRRWLPLMALLVVMTLCLSGCNPFKWEALLTSVDGEYQDKSSCWGCLIFEALFNAIDDMVTSLYPIVVNGCRSLLAIIFALWIAFKVGSMFFSFKQPDIAEFWSEFARTGLAVIFCAAILASKDTLFDLLGYTLIPVFEGAIQIGVAIINESFGDLQVEAAYNSCTVYDVTADSAKALGDGMREALTCLIFEMHRRLTYGYFFAYKLMGIGEFAEFFLGLFLLFIFFLISLAFPFYLVDGIFRIGIVFVILPILVVFWPFKPLRQFASAAWRLSFGSFVQITMMTVFITLIVEVVIDFTNVSVNRIDTSETFISENVAAPEKIFFMLFVAVYAIKFMGKVSAIAAQLANSKPNPAFFSQAVAKLTKMALIMAQMASRGAKLAKAKGKNNKNSGE